jgi:leader peptidase (prepilin peptidase)/N-methyltransferase
MAGYVVLWTVYHGFRLLTGREGMGYGDFKLLALLGAWLGWQAIPAILILASLAGTIAGITLIACKRASRDTPLPFGPYLAAAGLLVLYCGDTVNAIWLGFLAGTT